MPGLIEKQRRKQECIEEEIIKTVKTRSAGRKVALREQ